MRQPILMAAMVCAMTLPAVAQTVLPQAALTDTEVLGTVATLAPLCALRDESWAEDLRRSALQSATGTKSYDDTGLRDAPGSNVAAAVLGDAEHEALEAFTEAPGGKTCDKIAKSADLTRADDRVRSFRSGKAGQAIRTDQRPAS